MGTTKKIGSALISVFNKDNLEPIIEKLSKLGVKLYSTGGTHKFIEELGYDVVAIEDITSYPSILGGRVKTLHPKVFGGILARRDNDGDVAQLAEYEIPELDLVIVDLYPFEATVAAESDEQSIVEKIDIGGISLIRAAAKNFKDTMIIPSMSDYGWLSALLDEKNGSTDLEDRKYMAVRAFNVSSHYDTAIFNYFNKEQGISSFKSSQLDGRSLRYGENPHQTASFYGKLDDMFEQINGKELSYNNLVDIDAAVNLMREFDQPTFAVLKHTNPCGVATRANLKDAWIDALAGDPISAFGGILVTNTNVDVDTAEEINKLFFEVLIAPSFDDAALETLKSKKNRILLLQKESIPQSKVFKSLLNGVIEMDADLKTETASDFNCATKAQPSSDEIEDLVFANKISKHTKSNTIVLAKNRQLVGNGTGQTSRVDALKQAVIKAKAFKLPLEGAVMASDAFFPFPDCVEIAHQDGINCVVQPGGSIRDEDSIKYCDENNMRMVLTGVRHFKH